MPGFITADVGSYMHISCCRFFTMLYSIKKEKQDELTFFIIQKVGEKEGGRKGGRVMSY